LNVRNAEFDSFANVSLEGGREEGLEKSPTGQ